MSQDGGYSMIIIPRRGWSLLLRHIVNKQIRNIARLEIKILIYFNYVTDKRRTSHCVLSKMGKSTFQLLT